MGVSHELMDLSSTLSVGWRVGIEMCDVQMLSLFTVFRGLDTALPCKGEVREDLPRKASRIRDEAWFQRVVSNPFAGFKTCD